MIVVVSCAWCVCVCVCVYGGQAARGVGARQGLSTTATVVKPREAFGYVVAMALMFAITRYGGGICMSIASTSRVESVVHVAANVSQPTTKTLTRTRSRSAAVFEAARSKNHPITTTSSSPPRSAAGTRGETVRRGARAARQAAAKRARQQAASTAHVGARTVCGASEGRVGAATIDLEREHGRGTWRGARHSRWSLSNRPPLP